MTGIKNNAYGVVQNPKWTQKHSYAVVFSLVFILFTFFSASKIIFVDGDGWSGMVTVRGFPFMWLVTRSGTYFDYDVDSVSGLLLDLLLYSVVSILIVYPKQLVQYLRSKK